MNTPQLDSDIDTEEEIRSIFNAKEVEGEDYRINDYSFQEFVDSTRGYSATVSRVASEGYDTETSVDSTAERFLEWFAREDEVIDITEADIDTDMTGRYGIDMNRAVLMDGVHPDNMQSVEHEFYDELPQYFTVFGLVNDDEETAEIYYKNVHPEKILSGEQRDSIL